jgi:hypothetical protein
MNDICAISTKTSGGRMLSKIILSVNCNISPFTVNETPELIIKSDNQDFILLHEYETNFVFIVRKNIIAVVDTVKNNGKIKSCVYFDSSCDLKPMAFHESPDKIYEKLTVIETNT